jgi:hypothetical protein
MSDARAAITDAFGDAQSSGAHLQDERWVALLEPWERAGLQHLASEQHPVRRFVYDGAVHFNRWSVPTPVVEAPDSSEHFDRFLKALQAAEGSSRENVAVLELHAVRTELYRNYAVNDGSFEAAAEPCVSLTAIGGAADAVDPPTTDAKRVEFEGAMADMRALLAGIESGDLRAEVRFKLPHPVIRRRVAGVASWRGTAIEFVLTPHPTDVEGISAVDGVVSTSGATRWPSGTCEVSLSLLKLVDHAAPTPALVANPEPPGSPHAHTPLAQALVYVLTADLLAALVGELPEDVDSLWVLTPRDISQYSFRQHANGRAVVDIPMVSIGGWRISAGALKPLEMHLAQLESEPYWQLGYRQAAAYLALGATRESVAWINMAAESLIDSRIAELVARRPELEGTFTSGRLLFAEAESVVTSQFPDLAGRVEWPDAAVQPSRWSQLKALQRAAPLPVSHREITQKYARVTAGRNDLLHGRHRALPSAAAVVEALEGLRWLIEQLRLPSDPAPMTPS